MVSAKAIELIANKIVTCGKTLDVQERESTVSKATLSRIVNKHAASRPVLDILAAYFEVGEEYQKLVDSDGHTCAFASELVEELKATRSYYESKAASVRAHYESQIASLKEQLARDTEARDKERTTQRELYKESTEKMQAEINRLQGVITSFTTKRNIVFWVLVAIIVFLGVALLVALKSDAVL